VQSPFACSASEAALGADVAPAAEAVPTSFEDPQPDPPTATTTRITASQEGVRFIPADRSRVVQQLGNGYGVIRGRRCSGPASSSFRMAKLMSAVAMCRRS
jgi:hypothetical protein